MRNASIVKKISIFALVVVLLASACTEQRSVQTITPQADGSRPKMRQQGSERENICYEFVKCHMLLASGGVRTNYLDGVVGAELASGAEVLLESMGLLMLYAGEAGDEALFQSLLRFVQDRMDTGHILSYRYSPEVGAYPVNAFVDDIRVIRALLLAGDLFGEYYKEIALGYADRLYGTNVREGRVYDMYDETQGAVNGFITLCYIDLETLQRLSEYDERWEKVLENALGIAKGGYISDRFPLYQSAYSYDTGEYYSRGEIVTVQAALTILNLAQVGECPQNAIDYLKDGIKNGTLYGEYRPDGTPKNNTESTAIYAICAMIATVVNDREMYGLSIERMNMFQVTDRMSEVYGAFANAKTLELYSFDNLTALLAYRQELH